MDAYHPETVFSSIDRNGRYAYGKQPQILGWNLARLGEALMPLFDSEPEKAVGLANESLKKYGDLFGAAYLAGLRRKFGLFTEREEDREIVQGFLKLLMDNGLDYTGSFRRLSHGEMPSVDDDGWARSYRARLALEPQDATTRQAAMRAVNPVYIPRNHLVEAALAAAMQDDDLAPFEELLAVLAKPFEERSQYAAYADPPPEADPNYRTFCGT